MRVLLIQPEWQSAGVGFRLAAMPEPLALELLAAHIPDHEVRILDMRLDGDLNRALREFAPEVVGITALTTEVYAAQDVLAEVRKFSSDIFTVVGGHHASLLQEDFHLPQVDAIVIGEAETAFPMLISTLASGSRNFSEIPNLVYRSGNEFVATGKTAPLIQMDNLLLPRRDLVQQYRSEYFFLFDKPDTSVETGRGCPHRCNFCSVWKFNNGKIRQMSTPRVIQEIKTVKTAHITFMDDNFLMNHRRAHEIADALKADGVKMRYSMQCRTDSIVAEPELIKKWVDVGLYAVLLGLEGASDATLKNVNKKNNAKTNDEAIKILHDLGVIIWGCFIADPDWEEADFKRLKDYVTEKEITHTQFTVLTPLPGTDLYNVKKPDLLSLDYTCYDAIHSVLPTRLPREEFYKQFAKLYHQRDVGPYYDLLSAGKLTIEDVKRGKKMLDAMSEWEYYIPNDPVLGEMARKRAVARNIKAPGRS